jgi:hypothetical protein
VGGFWERPANEHLPFEVLTLHRLKASGKGNKEVALAELDLLEYARLLSVQRLRSSFLPRAEGIQIAAQKSIDRCLIPRSFARLAKSAYVYVDRTVQAWELKGSDKSVASGCPDTPAEPILQKLRADIFLECSCANAVVARGLREGNPMAQIPERSEGAATCRRFECLPRFGIAAPHLALRQFGGDLFPHEILKRPYRDDPAAAHFSAW